MYLYLGYVLLIADVVQRTDDINVDTANDGRRSPKETGHSPTLLCGRGKIKSEYMPPLHLLKVKDFIERRFVYATEMLYSRFL